MMTNQMSTQQRKLTAIIVFLTTAVCTAFSTYVGEDFDHVCSATRPSIAVNLHDQGGAPRKIIS